MNIEELFDFTNWREHPTQKRYFVFFFSSIEQGNYFEQLLVEHKVWFEKHLDDDDVKRPIWFAIERGEMETVKRLNHLALGKYRDRFIPSTGLRWAVFVLSGIIVALMIMGIIKNGFH
jgi:hypothetical protein